jgi:hypothetical protein
VEDDYYTAQEAARNSSEPAWRDTWLVTDWQEPVEDLSE